MSKKDALVVRYIPIGVELKGKTFKNFDSLRKKTNRIVRPFRDDWMATVFLKNNVFVNPAVMTRREMVEIFEQNKISVVDEGYAYRIYKGDEIIGEWDNRRKIVFDDEGRLSVKLQYLIL